jgi:hypothetical protein
LLTIPATGVFLRALHSQALRVAQRHQFPRHLRDQRQRRDTQSAGALQRLRRDGGGG